MMRPFASVLWWRSRECRVSLQSYSPSVRLGEPGEDLIGYGQEMNQTP